MEIDDSLYSRQRYMLGDDAMKKLMRSNVLLIGCGSSGIEIAKNIVLAGVKALCIIDDEIISLEDVGNNFFVAEEDINMKKSRSAVVVPRLSELNPSVNVSTATASMCDLSDSDSTTFLVGFQCIVMTECDMESQILMNEFCRSQTSPIKFISCDVYGALASLFCDFGQTFQVFDVNGEDPKEVFIGDISQDNPGIVTTLDQQRHGFESGDFVTFRELEGMKQLNKEIHKIEVLTPFTFSIGDTTSNDAYLRNGIATQTKSTTCLQFNCLREQLIKPDILDVYCGSSFPPAVLHLSYQVLLEYKKLHGYFPRTNSDEKEILNIARSIDNDVLQSANSIVVHLTRCSSGLLLPLCSAIGGIAAQEVLIALTGKYTPIRQWLFLDALSLLADVNVSEEVHDDKQDRYSQLRLCIGADLMERLQRLNVFMVGCGAIGCEMLKNMAMIGISTHLESGKITVTDPDLIEKSNLNRQFLFRNHHIRQMKSKVAAESVHRINSNVKILPMEQKVDKDTEETIFTDPFFKQQDIVVNALDNIPSRLYMDSRCVSNYRPLIETGTSGPKGHVQVIVPGLTESYESQNDPPEFEVPLCTLKSFPATSTHCVQWANLKFYEHFFDRPALYNEFWNTIYNHSPPDVGPLQYFSRNLKKYKENASRAVSMALDRPVDWSGCISRGRRVFEKAFNHAPRKIIRHFPLDHTNANGTPFWTFPRRRPTPVTFNHDDPLHMSFVKSYAKVYARQYSIEVPEFESDGYAAGIESGIRNCKVPQLSSEPKAISIDEHTPSKVPKTSAEDIPEKALLDRIELLRKMPEKSLPCLLTQTFEKDDDSNGQVDFMTAASNIRCVVYGLPLLSKLETKKIAGRIVPAIATTTSAIAGLATLELMQVVKREGCSMTDLGVFHNAFLNTALPMLVLSQPGEAKEIISKNGKSFTLWDTWEVRGNSMFTLQNFLDHLQAEYQITASMVSQETRLIYFLWLPKHKERLDQKMFDLLKRPTVEYVDLTVAVENEDDLDDDQDVPTVRYYF